MARNFHWLYFVGYNAEDALYSPAFSDYGNAVDYRNAQADRDTLHIYKAFLEVILSDLKNAEV